MTDHRVGITLYKLDLFMQGEIEEIIESLKVHFREKSLKEAGI